MPQSMGSVRCISIICPSSRLKNRALKTLCRIICYGIWVPRASCTYSMIVLQVLNLTLMGEATEHDASGPNGASNGPAFSSAALGLPWRVRGLADGLADGPRLAAPPAARPYSRPRTRRLTHDLASGRARVEAIFSSSSVPSQRSNTLPYED